MKIGAFAKHNGTTIDTIRHYMEMSILNPDKINGYYMFDAQCQKDYEVIASLKKLGFLLSEIQTLMLFERVGRHTGYHQRKTYRAFYNNKLEWIRQERNRLDAMQKKLEEEIEAIPVLDNTQATLVGVPLEALSVLSCQQCKSPYQLLDGQIEHGEIMQGTLQCSCGSTLEIREGIAYGHKALDPSMAPMCDDTFIEEYIQTTHVDYLKNLHRTLQWTKEHNIFEGSHGGVTLELGSGRGFFLRNMLEKLSENMLYIAIDHNPHAHRWLQKAMAIAGQEHKILFVCCDFKQIPLKEQSVDYMIDATGSTNYAFEHEDFLASTLIEHLKVGGTFQGHYLLFENFSVDTIIQKESRQWFQQEHVEKTLSDIGLQVEETFITPSVGQGGPGENFFVPGEKIYNYLYIGKKS